MKKFLRMYGLMLLALPLSVKAQNNVREEVYLQLSSTDLIVGESLHFSAFVSSQATGKPSQMSKLLYVALLDEKSESVYQTKVAIVQGRGHGVIFMPSALESSNYHVVAYTRWMRNFDDFFHQRIVVINPYKPLNKSKLVEDKVDIAFHPESGHLVTAVKNNIVLRATDTFSRGVEVQGKIVASTGEKLAEVRTNKAGFFEFSLTPQVGVSYQFIREFSGEFQFYELPKSKAGLSIQVESDADYLKIGLEASNLEKSKGQLSIYLKDQTVFEQTISLTGEVVVHKKSLPKGLLVMEIQADKRYERLIWNGELLKSQAQEVTAVHPASAVINWPLKVPSSSDYSVTVHRVNPFELATSLVIDRSLNSQIDLPQTMDFYRTSTADELDQLMIASQSIFKRSERLEVAHLPEYRYGLIEGVVTDERGEAQAGVEVVLTLQGKDQYLSATNSDANGRFALRYDSKSMHQDGTVSMLDEQLAQIYQIELRSEFREEFPIFSNPAIAVDSIVVANIIQRSINNQLENAFQIRENKADKEVDYTQFSGAKRYDLEDYTQFPSMRDVFIEYIPEVSVSKNETKFGFKMNTLNTTYKNKDESKLLILLDGKYATAEDVLTLPPLYVAQVDILNEKLFHGQIAFNGVISVHTSTHDGLKSPLRGREVHPTAIQVAKTSAPDNSADRLPNRKGLLYWNPLIRAVNRTLDVSFRSSAVPGLYQIKVDGIDSQGRMHSGVVRFEIQ